jgi:hypothetical protein
MSGTICQKTTAENSECLENVKIVVTLLIVDDCE